MVIAPITTATTTTPPYACAPALPPVYYAVVDWRGMANLPGYPPSIAPYYCGPHLNCAHEALALLATCGGFSGLIGPRQFGAVCVGSEPATYRTNCAGMPVVLPIAYGPYAPFNPETGRIGEMAFGPCNWPKRERERFECGAYEPTPWHGQSWAQAQHETLFAHMSINSPGMVSFTESPQKGQADIQAKGMAPGRFLTKYFGHILSPTEVEAWANQAALAAGLISLQVTRDADEIEAIFEHGPRSCMAGPASGFEGSEHPARVYAGPELAIAFLGNLETNDIHARCVIWPDKMLHSTVYAGDTSRLRKVLEASGYTEGSMSGALIQLIRDENHSGYVIPYVDGVDGASLSDCGHIRLGRHGDISTRQTSGCSHTWHCASCGEGADEEQAVWVADVEEHWCDNCGNETYYCEYSGERFSAGVVEVNGHRRYNHVHIEHLPNIDVSLVDGGERDGEYWHDNHTFYCEDCSTTFHDDDRVIVEDCDVPTCTDCSVFRQAQRDADIAANAELDALLAAEDALEAPQLELA